jgi:hypothetical protein
VDIGPLTQFLVQYKMWFFVGMVAAGAIWMIVKLFAKTSGQQQNQRGGAHSTNVQAGGDIHIGSDGEGKRD